MLADVEPSSRNQEVGTYRDDNFRSRRTLWHILVLAVDATLPDFLKSDGVLAVRHLITDDCVAQLGNSIHERLVLDSKGDVSRPAASSNSQRPKLYQARARVIDKIYANEVSA